MTAPESTQAPLQIRRDQAGRLCLFHEGKWVYVQMRPCFPWRKPNEFLTLRTDTQQELALIRHLSDLPPDSRSAIEAALEEAHFAFRITGVESIERDFEVRIWNVQTQTGPRRFTTKLDDWPHQQPGGRILIRDLAGDTYVVENLNTLDKPSRDLLWAYVV